MYPTMKLALASATTVAALLTADSTSFVHAGRNKAADPFAVRQAACASPGDGTSRTLRLLAQWLVTESATSEMRSELELPTWHGDSVQIVTDEPLCSRVDSLIVAWLAGPGAGKLVGVTGTVGPVLLARIGPTTFLVQPGDTVPPQPVPQYPYFVVDTAPPVRIGYFGAAP